MCRCEEGEQMLSERKVETEGEYKLAGVNQPAAPACDTAFVPSSRKYRLCMDVERNAFKLNFIPQTPQLLLPLSNSTSLAECQ